MALILAFGLLHSVDPPPITVYNITWYYGAYPEGVYNGSVVYVGPGISSNVTVIINYQGQLPTNVTYKLAIGKYVINGVGALSPGINTINITTPALNQGYYNASLTISSQLLGFTENYVFSVNVTKPVLMVNVNKTTVYSGVPQSLNLHVTNGTPIPITYASILISTENSHVSPQELSLKPPGTLAITITPGSYNLKNAFLTLEITYVDAGGYQWVENETLVFNVVETPVKVSVNASGTVTYGNYLPISIMATTPVGPLAGQSMNIYVDGNYITTVVTNTNGQVNYKLPVNFNVGYHTLTVVFLNTTYFKPATVNYTFIVIPGTVQIIPYVNSTEITYGESVNIKVTLSPQISSGTLTIGYVLNGQSVSIGGYTPVNGVVDITWTPPQAGTYIITLYYSNPPNYLPSSYNLTLIVNKAPCTLTITTSGNLTVLHMVSIISLMKPAVVNAPITLLIKGVNETMTTTINVNSTGYAVYTFIPLLPGEYTVYAQWGGNINYNACSASLGFVISKASSLTNVHVSSNVAVVGDYLSITVDVLSDIPANYVYGNVTVVLRNISNNSTKVFIIPLSNARASVRIPLTSPGTYEVMGIYGGNTYVLQSMSAGVYINVMPGILGIPWYVLLAYVAPLVLGIFIGIALNRYLRQST